MASSSEWDEDSDSPKSNRLILSGIIELHRARRPHRSDLQSEVSCSPDREGSMHDVDPPSLQP